MGELNDERLDCTSPSAITIEASKANVTEAAEECVGGSVLSRIGCRASNAASNAASSVSSSVSGAASGISDGVSSTVDSALATVEDAANRFGLDYLFGNETNETGNGTNGSASNVGDEREARVSVTTPPRAGVEYEWDTGEPWTTVEAVATADPQTSNATETNLSLVPSAPPAIPPGSPNGSGIAPPYAPGETSLLLPSAPPQVPPAVPPARPLPGTPPLSPDTAATLTPRTTTESSVWRAPLRVAINEVDFRGELYFVYYHQARVSKQ